MAKLDNYIDWTGCELVERIPGKVSGRPVVRGTRILADTIVQDAELGSSQEEIHENYPDLSLATIQQLIAFASSNRAELRASPGYRRKARRSKPTLTRIGTLMR